MINPGGYLSVQPFCYVDTVIALKLPSFRNQLLPPPEAKEGGRKKIYTANSNSHSSVLEGFLMFQVNARVVARLILGS